MKHARIEEIRRFTKTARMVAQIDATVIALDLDPFKHAAKVADYLRTFDEKKWETIAAASGTKIPSWRTIERVIEIFDDRAEALKAGKLLRPTARALTKQELTGK